MSATSPLSPADRAETQAELDRLHVWAVRNAHRADDSYRLLQKPANDLHTARLERLLREES